MKVRDLARQVRNRNIFSFAADVNIFGYFGPQKIGKVFFKLDPLRLNESTLDLFMMITFFSALRAGVENY